MKRYLVIGASRGIGAAVAKHLALSGHEIITVSRSPGPGEWIKADISNAEGIELIATALAGRTIDGLLFMGGVWENGAFTSSYDFAGSPDEETRFVISVNLIAPIELTKQLHSNLQKSDNPRSIFIGALSGLDNSTSAIQALRLCLVDSGIGFTVINPGNLETEEVLTDIKEGRFPDQFPIPLKDLCSLIDWILSLSRHTEVGEVSLIQK
jgi:3-oxoacyl-[acyl-carrier protein] reductase